MLIASIFHALGIQKEARRILCIMKCLESVTNIKGSQLLTKSPLSRAYIALPGSQKESKAV